MVNNLSVYASHFHLAYFPEMNLEVLTNPRLRLFLSQFCLTVVSIADLHDVAGLEPGEAQRLTDRFSLDDGLQ
jgi:hypothetical protein